MKYEKLLAIFSLFPELCIKRFKTLCIEGYESLKQDSYLRRRP